MSVIRDGNFSTALAVSKPFFRYPFPQNDSRVMTQEFEIDADEYSRLPISDPHPDFVNMYLVAERMQSVNFGNILRFEREYSEIPQSRSEYESFANRFAGLSVGDAEPQSYSVASQSAGNPSDTITAATGFEAEVGDALAIEWEYDNGFITYGGTVQRVAVSVSGATVSFPFFRFEYWSGGQTIAVVPTYQRVTNISGAGRDPFTKVVQSEIKYDYYLPGVSAGIAIHSDIPIITTETILTNEGSKTDSYSPQTFPTRESYENRIAAGTLIVAESSTARRWRGEIYERATRYVVAE